MTVTDSHGSIACWAPAYDSPRSWRDDAACKNVDPVVFFPEPTNDRKNVYNQARSICSRCEVVEECLADALQDTFADHGFRGGMTAKERARAKGQRERRWR